MSSDRAVYTALSSDIAQNANLSHMESNKSGAILVLVFLGGFLIGLEYDSEIESRHQVEQRKRRSTSSSDCTTTECIDYEICFWVRSQLRAAMESYAKDHCNKTSDYCSANFAGDPGEKGECGKQGDNGEIGEKGTKGKEGINGALGKPGPAGPQGKTSSKGDKGEKGEKWGSECV